MPDILYLKICYHFSDVLKPEEDLVTEGGETKRAGKRHHSSADQDPTSPKKIKKEKSTSHKVEKSSSSETVTRWVVSTEFRKEQERLKFPTVRAHLLYSFHVIFKQ